VDVATKAFDLRMAGDATQARRVLDEGLAADAKDARAWFESARLRFYMCEFTRAARDINKAIKLDPDNPRYHCWLGHISTFNAVWSMHNLFGAIAMPGLMADARKAYARAVELDPDFHQARYDLINLYIQNPGSNLARAREHTQELSKRDAVWGARANTKLFRDKSPAEQIAVWKPVVAEHPARADAHAGLADAYSRAGEYSAAVAEYAKARELDPGPVEWLFAIARCHQATKSVDAQADTLQQILGIEPPAPLPSRLRAMRYLSSLEKARGNTERAEQLQREANEKDPRYGKKGEVRDNVPDLFTKP
jgi:cytochrome c-type biogenesis protein CcmH/NrfG